MGRRRSLSRLSSLGAVLVVLLLAAFVAWGQGDGSGAPGDSGRSASDPASTSGAVSGSPSGSPAGSPVPSSGVASPRPSGAPSAHWDRGPDGQTPTRGHGGRHGGSSGGTDPVSGLAWIEESELTPEARETLGLIDDGGPFPYPGKDGSTFGNFEGILPRHQRGYYAEYTVPTPGERDRGARRIIVGDGGELYWTADHYDSFERIRRDAR